MMEKEIERRFMPLVSGLAWEARAEGSDSKNLGTLEGLGIVYNKRSKPLDGFTEVVSPEFFKGMDIEDCIGCFNHRDEYLLGTIRSKTLRLEETSEGIRYIIDVPDTSWGRDTAVSVDRKDITGSSFRFRTLEDDWKVADDGTVVRTLMKGEKLFDIGPVIRPAYADTSISKRSLDDFAKFKGSISSRSIDHYRKILTVLNQKMVLL